MIQCNDVDDLSRLVIITYQKLDMNVCGRTNLLHIHIFGKGIQTSGWFTEPGGQVINPESSSDGL